MKIIRDQDDLLKFVETNASADFNYFKPTIKIAERRYLVPVIGNALYLKMGAALAGSNEIQPELAAAIELAQEAVANIAVALSVSRLAVSFDENGARRPESEKVKTAYQYQEINFRDSFVRAGYDALDELLGLMEDQLAKFPEWKDSGAYSDYKRYFIQSGKQFSESFDIRNARYTYVCLRSTIRRVEDLELRPALGNSLFDALKQQVLAGTLTEPNTKLLENYIRPALAIMTIARAVIEKSVDVSDFGVSINIIQDNKNSQQKQAAPLDKITAAAQQLRADGDQYMKRLAEELSLNPDDYPDYTPPPEERGFIDIKNKQENAFVAI